MAGAFEEVGGLISENTTWDADIIRVVESVEVAETAALTIAPGTRVEFAGFFRILVRGQLWAVGEPGQRIHFTAAAEQLADGWDGIDFLNIPAANGHSRLEHCHLSRAVAKPAKNGTTRPQTGGAVSIVGVNKLTIASCVFRDNRADFGGAIYCGYGSSPLVAGNLFHNNSVTMNGSVLFNVYAYPKLINNTIVDNTCLAENEFHLCGAVENFNGKIPLVNNIIWDNFTNHYSGTQLVENKDYYTLANNIEGYVGNISNLDSDPGFYGSGVYPYQLLEGSACIDLGLDHTLASALADLDISGNDRLCGFGIDMGAHEYCGELSSVSPGQRAQALTCVPNPFNAMTEIRFDLNTPGTYDITIFDITGKKVTSFHGEGVVGINSVRWDGRDDSGRPTASGAFFYRLDSGDFHETRKMVMVK